MHIPDGVLPVGVCVAGYAASAGLTWLSLRQIRKQPDYRASLPRAALLTAAFFVASWIHIPIPPTSVHLILNGLLGATLGFYAFPAILVGLFFQAVMFQHGGLTTLGVNAAMMGGPALLAYGLFRLRFPLRLNNRFGLSLFGFLGGAGGLGAAVLIFYTLLISTIPAELDPLAERAAITALSLAHIPLMLLEGLFTVLVVLFLQRVDPALLGNPVAATAASNFVPQEQPAGKHQ